MLPYIFYFWCSVVNQMGGTTWGVNLYTHMIVLPLKSTKQMMLLSNLLPVNETAAKSVWNVIIPMKK